MPLKFFPFHQSIKNRHVKEQQLTLFVLLADLKSQQLPFTSTQFTTIDQHHFQQQDNNSIKPQSKISSTQTKKFHQFQQVYRNTHSILWISQPVPLAQNIKTQSQHHQISVRFLYLPPLSEYFKFYMQRLITQSINYNTHQGSFSQQKSKNQLPIKFQLMLEQKHQLMYSFARSLSSTVLYDFSSKYIRFDHMGLLTDPIQAVDLNSQRENNQVQAHNKRKVNYFSEMSTFFSLKKDKLILGEGEQKDKSFYPKKKNKIQPQKQNDIPCYVMIKTGSYTNENSYEIHGVKFPQSGRMQIQSGKILSISSVNQTQRIILSESCLIGSPVGIAAKLLGFDGFEFMQDRSRIGSQTVETRYEDGKFLKNKWRVVDFGLLSGIMANLCIHNQFQCNSKSNSQLCMPNLYNNKTKTPLLLSRQILESSFCRYMFFKTLQQEVNSIASQQQQQGMIEQIGVNRIVCDMNQEGKMMQQGKVSQKNVKERIVQRGENIRWMAVDVISRLYFFNKSQSQQIGQSRWQEIKRKMSFKLIEVVQKIVLGCLGGFLKIQQANTFNILRNSIAQQKNSDDVDRLVEMREIITIFSQSGLATGADKGLIYTCVQKIQQLKNQQAISLLFNQTQQFKRHNNITNNISHTSSKLTTQSSTARQTTRNRPQMINQGTSTIQQSLINALRNQTSLQLQRHLRSKLKLHNIQHSDYLGLLFSFPLQINKLNQKVLSQGSIIQSLNTRIGILQAELSQKESQIQQKSQRITKYKQQEVFYQQVLNELNQTQFKLQAQTQQRKRLSFELQCVRIQNIQLKQLMESYKIKQSRLSEEKANFLQAISHLTKQNLHYITLSEERLKEVNLLKEQLEKYKFIDLTINELKLQNHTLHVQIQGMTEWKETTQTQHQSLIDQYVAKFNFVLKQNFLKYQQKDHELLSLKELLNHLNQKLQHKNNHIHRLQDQIQLLKTNYFNERVLGQSYVNSSDKNINNEHFLVNSKSKQRIRNKQNETLL